MFNFRTATAGAVLTVIAGLIALATGLSVAGAWAPVAVVLAALLVAANIVSLKLVVALRGTHKKVEDARAVEVGLRTGISAREGRDSRDQLIRQELAGEVVASIRGAAEISQETRAASEGMQGFDGDFSSAALEFGRINEAVDGLREGILSAASATEQSSAAIEEIGASITRISEESSARYEQIRELPSAALAGREEMERTMRIFRDLVGGIGDLKDFIEAINEIAARTSVLAMNAAIQAAHAGESGKGFAVVADEIRKLAGTSAENAGSISERLGKLILQIGSAESISRHAEEIFSGVEQQVGLAADSFIMIKDGTKELALGGKEIVEASLSLRDTSIVMRDNVGTVSRSVKELEGTLSRLKSESSSLSDGLRRIHGHASDLNLSFLSVAQGNINQMDPESDSANAIVVQKLSHSAWVARIRASLDGKFTIGAKEASDLDSCALDLGSGSAQEAGDSAHGPGDSAREALAAHKAFHTLAGKTLSELKAGNTRAAETAFEALVAKNAELLSALGSCDGKGGVFMPWQTSYELGNATIDPQHQELVRLINVLYAAIHEGKGKHLLADILAELVRYTEYHFEAEEQLFLESSYPGKKGHLAQHRAFVEKILALKSDFESGAAVLGSSVLDFLREWLVKHILASDRAYVPFLGNTAKKSTKVTGQTVPASTT